LHFPGARALKCGAKNNKKSSHSSPINSKKIQLIFFAAGLAGATGFVRVARVMGCRQLSTIPVDNLVY
jgi:hypothetical protein